MLLALSTRLLLREIKSGYLTSMLISLTLAITIVSGISLFTDRLEKALNAQTEEFLGGNLKFESNNDNLGMLSEKLDLKNKEQMKMAMFASVVFSAEDMQSAIEISNKRTQTAMVSKSRLVRFLFSMMFKT